MGELWLMYLTVQMGSPAQTPANMAHKNTLIYISVSHFYSFCQRNYNHFHSTPKPAPILTKKEVYRMAKTAQCSSGSFLPW